MKRIIMLFAFLEVQKYGMKSFLIALVVMVTAAIATVNVVLNEKAPFVSNMTLQNMEAFTNGESGPEWLKREISRFNRSVICIICIK